MSSFSPTILLVDDDEPTRRILRRWLTHLGAHAHILEAEDGEQALEFVQAHCHATQEPGSLLVLLDLSMPVMDGLEFLEHQAQLPLGCRQAMTVIVVSILPPSPDEQERVRSMATAIRPKPLDIDQLQLLLHEYLPAALR